MSRPRIFTDAELLRRLRQVSRDGVAPHSKAAGTLVRTLQYRFGSYAKAIALAGLKPMKRGRPSMHVRRSDHVTPPRAAAQVSEVREFWLLHDKSLRSA